MKKIFSLLCAALFASCAFAAEAKSEARAMLLCRGGMEVDLEKTSAKAQPAPDGKKLDLFLAASESGWKTAKIVFKATGGKQARVLLYGYGKNSIWYSNFKVNGKLVGNGDFSNGFEKWVLPKGGKSPAIGVPPAAKRIQSAACAASGKFVARDIPIKVGETVEIQFDYMLAKPTNKNASLDVAAAAQEKGLTNPSFVKGFAPSEYPKAYGGMVFDYLKRDGGVSCATIAPRRNLFVSPAKPAAGKYVYLLHSARVNGNKDGIGVMRIRFSTGKRVGRFLKFGSEAANYDEKAGDLDNAICVYKDNPKDGTGGVYLTRINTIAGAQSVEPIADIEFVSSSDWTIFGAVVSSSEVFTSKILEFPPDKWKEMEIDTFEVKEGTALDMSAKVAAGAPAGKYGRVVVGESGRFEFENRKGVEVRFKGANFWDLISQFGSTITTHEQIDRHVRMLKKQGFNALRWRMDVEKAGVFEAPYKIKDSYWDLYDYLLYALGREGIYSYFYICSHSIGNPSFKWNDRYAVKVKMSLGDPDTWEDWRKFAKMQLEHYNPYTRKKWKDDPSIATVEYWNEFCLGMPHSGACEPSIRKFVQKKWEEYLERRYKTIENFNAENKRLGLVWVPAKKVPQKFSDVVLTTGKQYEYYKNYKHPDFARFVVENVSEMQKFFRKVVREEIGMKAPAFQNNCVKQMYWTFLSAMVGDCISINTYHSGATTFGVGARMKQISSITGGANYFCGSLAKHVDGMPLTVTEYNHCYYNMYTHEAGLVFPSYAALQDYSALMIFDCPVADQPKNLNLRRVGVNPVFRVNDFLTNFIYERGDVKASKHKIDIVYDGEFLQKSPYSTGGMNWSQSKLGLMAGTYIALPDVKKVPELSHVKVKPADASFKYAPPSEIKTSTNASEIGESGGDFDWKPVMAELRQKGILPKGNRSDPAKGVFESDTGEIYLDCASRLIEVNTPKLCGAVVNPDTKNLKVGALEVRSSSARACVAAVALDNVELAKSKHIMLTLSTDVVYKSSKFSINRDQLFDFGKPPILLEVCKLSAAIDSNIGAEFDVYPLKMSGERIESAKFTARAVNGKIPINVDTAKIPVVYFELVAK